MIPKDAPQEDWALYYHDTYMAHVKYGPCRVVIQTSDAGYPTFLAAEIDPKTINLKANNKVMAKDLRIMWPRPGAYNFSRLKIAAFIGRTPQRHMKRSAYSDHYYIQWSPKNITTTHMMTQIALHPIYTRVNDFNVGSRAISNKVILYKPRPGKVISVMYMAEYIGILNMLKFVPSMPHDSRLPRILKHLAGLGIELSAMDMTEYQNEIN